MPLGGVGEIGMNLALYGYGPPHKREWIMVDCGVTFAGPNLPGVDLELPDVRYAIGLGDDLKAIVITHAHEDHYGALLSLWPMLEKPVYCTPFCAGMLEAKAAWEHDAPEIKPIHYDAGQTFEIGPFSIEAIYVTHSIPEPMSLAITTPAGTAIHTGDWKLDDDPSLGRPTNAEAFKRLGKAGVLALISDSTNAMREGVSPSEVEVSDSLAQIIADAPGRVAVTTFSSNVGRIRSIAQAAAAAGRRVMLLGSSIRRVIDVASDHGYLDGIAEFADEDEFPSIDRRELVIVLTGSQGEARAALAKIARQEHRTVSLAPGDIVIYSSRTIPGNEKPIIETKNLLIDQGVKVIDDDDALVHVSGHPRRNELKTMLDWTKPQICVPVHGEAAHLTAHAELAREAGVPQVARVRNGDLLRLAPGAAEVIDQVPSGRICLDGKILGNPTELGVVARRKLSYVGAVAVSVVIDKRGRLADDIDIELMGMPQNVGVDESFDDVLYEAAMSAVGSIPPARRKDETTVEGAVRRAVRAAARDHWGKKPVTVVFVAKV